MHRLMSAISRRLFRPNEIISGYEHPELVELVFRKTVAYQPTIKTLDIGDARSVLDFGGGCGVHYKEADSDVTKWAVVETPAMTERAQELATDQLAFFSTIDAAARWLGDIDLMHSNGALQYTHDPDSTLKYLCRLGAKRMHWYRTPVWKTKRGDIRESLLGDNGPGFIQVRQKIVRYTETLTSEDSFLRAHDSYDLIERGNDWFKFAIR